MRHFIEVQDWTVFCVECEKGYATAWAIAHWYVDKQMKWAFFKKGFDMGLKLALILVLNY
jgi:hypothetical protein